MSRALGLSKLRTEVEQCELVRTDDSGIPGRLPDAVVYAETQEDIARTLAIAEETGLPVTPRAAGTGRTGGAVPSAGGIVLCSTRMRGIKDIDFAEGIAIVEPGVVLSELQAAVEREGWFYPPDPGSLAHCTLGGNVAENAAGPRALKYGATRDYVLGMDAVLMGGRRIFAGRRTKKGVTGYDVAGLLVGSEGTLAVFGDLVLRLVPKPEAVFTLLVLCETTQQASRAVSEIVARRVSPRCIELLDRRTLDAVRAHGEAIEARAGAMLLVEVDGDERGCAVQAERILDACQAAGALEVVAAQSPNQRDRLWSARRNMSYAIRKLSRHTLSEDVVVPRQRLSELVEAVQAIGERERIRALCYGHAGDGNLHVNFLWDNPDERVRVQNAIQSLFETTIALGGTLSGEHGIGLTKAAYLPLEQSPELIGLQQDLKRAFDPKGLLNPGKIFPRPGHGAC